MSAAIATGLFALGGAAIGGLASWAAASADGRAQRRHAREQRKLQLVDLRRETYIDFVAKADTVADAAREIYNHEDRQQVAPRDRERYALAWQQYLDVLAAVQVLGPESITAAAQALRESTADMCNQVDAWLQNGKWSKTDDEKYVSTDTARRERRTLFMTVARKVIEE